MQGCLYQNGLADRARGSGMVKVYWQQLLFTFFPFESFKDTRCQIDSEKVQCVTVVIDKPERLFIYVRRSYTGKRCSQVKVSVVCDQKLVSLYMFRADSIFHRM